MTHTKYDPALSGLLDDSDLVPTFDYSTVVLTSPVSGTDNTPTTLNAATGGDSTPVIDITVTYKPLFSFGSGVVGSGINNYNQWVGNDWDVNGVAHGIKVSNGQVKTLDAPFQGVTGTFARGINDKGSIVGWYDIGSQELGFSLKSGIWSSITIPGSDDTQVLGINNKGQMVGDYFNVDNSILLGYVGFWSQAGYNYTPIDVPGSTETVATCINGKGLIGGYYIEGGVEHGFVYNPSTSTFTTFDDPDYANNEVTGINNKGWLTGIGYDSLDVGHGWIEAPDRPIFAVTYRTSTGGTLVWGINNYNHIVGTTLVGTSTLDAFTGHFVIHLTP